MFLPPVLDEEPDDDLLDAHENELHAELEMALVDACTNAEIGGVLARAKAARDEHLLSEEAFRELLSTSGQEEFWDMLLL